MNKRNTIKVLLIDDNPEYAFCNKDFVGSIPYNIRNDSSIKRIPWVTRMKHSTSVLLFNKLEGIETYFELKWLQFFQDVYDYRNLSFLTKLNYGFKALSQEGYVPDIIVFDYALTDSKHENEFLNYLNTQVLNEFLNPNVRLRNFIASKNGESYTIYRDQDYKDSSSSLPKHDTNNDSYGLYCGSLLTEMFKYDIPIASIPVTRKDKYQINKEKDPAFFEWFINNTYHKIFDRNHRTNKDWNSILNDGLHVYRTEIKNMISNGKIHVDLSNLIKLLNGGFLKTNEGARDIQDFKFTTRYGYKNIPIDGLFIDKNINLANDIPKDLVDLAGERRVYERDIAIWNFLKDVLSGLIDASKLGVGKSDIEKAIEISNNLIKVFDSVDFKKRILLSHYHEKVNKYGIDNLNNDERSVYDECLKLFIISDDKIIKPGEYSLSILGTKGKEASKIINRLTTFFVATRLWERYCSYVSSIEDVSINLQTPSDQFHIALIPPKVADLLFVLFPIWTKHIVLMNEKGELLTNPKEDMGKTRLKTLCGFGHADINDVNGIDLRQQMSLGEYMIVKSFATSLAFKKTPFWLKMFKDE